MRLILTVCTVFMALISWSQSPPSAWFFGAQGYIDFSSGVGTALPSPSLMPSSLGCTVQSNTSGQTLFYSNGETVFNVNNAVMLNGTGLFGIAIGIWNTQEVIAIPDPGNPNDFYIFNIPGNGQDLYYSKVDMTLDGGLGGVTLKNILLQSNVNSQMSAVKHANCVDYWLMAHEAGSSDYLAYEITAAGIQAPVITSIGIPTITNGTFVGAMKFSPDASKLVSLRGNYLQSASNLQKNRFDLLDFDNATGILSNALSSPVGLYPPTAGNDYFMGVDFSSDGRVFYISQRGETNGGIPQIYQFDATIAAPWASSQVVSAYTSFPNVGGRPFGLQLGPDGKIYIAEVGTGFLGIINNPNQLGLGCGWQTNAVDLLGGISSVGLPSVVQSELLTDFVSFTSNGNCVGSQIDFNYIGATGIDSVLWDFGDGNSTSILSPNVFSTTHIYANPGIYNVEVIGWRNCISDTFDLDIIIDDLPNIGISDSTLCEGDSLVVDLSNLQDVSLLWSDGSTDSVYTIDVNGNYTITATTLNGCVVSDSAQITFIPFSVPVITLVNDTVCFGAPNSTLSATPIGGIWSGVGVSPTGVFDQSLNTGSFEVFYTTSGQCTDTDSATIFVEALPVVSFSADVLEGCEPLLVTFTNDNFIQGQNVNWQFGDNQSGNFLEQGQHLYTSAGNYDVSLTVTNPSGCSNTATNLDYITVFPNPMAAFTYSVDLSDTGSIVQFNDLSTNAVTWNWLFNNSSTQLVQNPVNFYSSAGEYSVQLEVISSEGCVSQTQRFLTIFEPFAFYVPNAFTPDGDERNNTFYPIISGDNLSEFEFSIFNRWGDQVFVSSELNEGWTGVDMKTGREAMDGVYSWKILIRQKENANVILKHGHVSLIR